LERVICGIGDEYFGAGMGTMFADLDVLAAGAISTTVSEDFDRYFASPSVYPISLFVRPMPDGLGALRADAEQAQASEARVFAEGIRASELVRQLVDGSLQLEWTDVRFVSDDPAKGLGEATADQLMITRLLSLLDRPRLSLDLVSAYFIPGTRGVEMFRQVAAAGVKVRILTNALETTDVAFVHAGYDKYRADLLSGGVSLYELKPLPGVRPRGETLKEFGSSPASLHAKTFAADGRRIFIGSFNFDPRSALLNCEMGLLIGSEALAGQMKTFFDTTASADSYEVIRSVDGALAWVEVDSNGRSIRHATEPITTLIQRAMVAVIGWLPIEWLL
jgi:putative cardiolipin synthase